jgi:hypothetical protein
VTKLKEVYKEKIPSNNNVKSERLFQEWNFRNTDIKAILAGFKRRGKKIQTSRAYL